MRVERPSGTIPRKGGKTTNNPGGFDLGFPQHIVVLNRSEPTMWWMLAISGFSIKIGLIRSSEALFFDAENRVVNEPFFAGKVAQLFNLRHVRRTDWIMPLVMTNLATAVSFLKRNASPARTEGSLLLV
jgi:hypothetical protein